MVWDFSHVSSTTILKRKKHGNPNDIKRGSLICKHRKLVLPKPAEDR